MLLSVSLTRDMFAKLFINYWVESGLACSLFFSLLSFLFSLLSTLIATFSFSLFTEMHYERAEIGKEEFSESAVISVPTATAVPRNSCSALGPQSPGSMRQLYSAVQRAASRGIYLVDERSPRTPIDRGIQSRNLFTTFRLPAIRDHSVLRDPWIH